jgi:hypothetical protein
VSSRDGTTSIQDLLRHEEELPVAASRSRSVAGWLVKTMAYAAGLAALAEFGLRLAGLSVPYLLAWTAFMAALVLRRLVQLAATQPSRGGVLRRQPAGGDAAAFQWGAEDGLRATIGRWESRLEWAHDSPDRFGRSVHARLIEHADELLRLRHGITRTTDPAGARAVLEEPLWTFLESPVTKPPSPRELAAVLARMEEL